MISSTTSFAVETNEECNRITNKFLSSIIENQQIPLPLRAQLSRQGALNSGEQLESIAAPDCCQVCGLKISIRCAKIRISKQGKKRKEKVMTVSCKGCSNKIFVSARLPNIIENKKGSRKASRTTSMKMKDSERESQSQDSKQQKTVVRSSSSQSLKITPIPRMLTPTSKSRVSRVNKLQRLALAKNTADQSPKVKANSLSSFLITLK